MEVAGIGCVVERSGSFECLDIGASRGGKGRMSAFCGILRSHGLHETSLR
jgi:hypothetical protein